MKQTITVRDSYSKNLKDAISSDLKGYVEVEVKNTKTGEIEHQENHNLIVYGGREWLLKKMFGLNGSSDTSCIRWVGFGCGGAESGNPLQTGTTVGSDADLYQPVRIRFNDETNTTNANQYYASRVLPNGSVVKGYYKQLTSVNLKEDHANPYIQNNIKKYPTLIAEIRVELSSDDCNGENYTENGALTAYQDINEAALFISDNSTDPGTTTLLTQRYIDIVNNKKVYNEGAIYTQGENTGITYEQGTGTLLPRWVINSISKSAYKLQVYNETNEDWDDIHSTSESTSDVISYQFKEGDSLRIQKTLVSGTTYKFVYYVTPSGGTEAEQSIPWTYTWIGDTDPVLRMIPTGEFELKYSNVFGSATSTQPTYLTIQYRNNENDPWEDLSSIITISGTDLTEKTMEVPIQGSGIYQNIIGTTMFRTNQTLNMTNTISIKSVSKSSDSSYIATYYLDDSVATGCDVDKISAGDFIYTADETAVDNKTNAIKKSSPLKVLSVHKKDATSTTDHNYFTIEKNDAYTKEYGDTPLTGYCYTPASSNPYTMFSRVCLSSIRKSCDRELAIVWKIYV